MKRAIGEAAVVLAAVVGLGGEWDDDRRVAPRRGALFVALQVLVVAVLVGLVIFVRQLFGSTPTAWVAWIIVGAVMLLPFGVQWFAAPPRRGTGVLVGLAVVAAVIALAYPFLAAPDTAFWPGYAVVVAAFVAGGAVFGGIATRRAEITPS